MFRAQDDPERIITTPIQRWQGDACVEDDDALAVEEPLEVRLGASPLAVIMRTPGHDEELAVGFLHGEGIVRSRADLVTVRLWQDEHGAFAQNRVTITLRQQAAAPGAWQRQFYATSSCGMCGKASIEAALSLAPPLARRLEVAPETLYAFPDRLRAAQAVFDRTGGLHAAGLFDLAGNLLALREDVGRHNAVDKLIGRALLDGALPLSERILLVSGRVSFEILQKALVARIPLIAAVSAPSSLAVSVARRTNIALIGFLRAGRLNVYA
ncbi:MAG TPA: formate dehydrogenase accessory sulfurtransferase FdhD [Chloroflexota bacterium]|nr:formate dehydrogenase accessory sulfurtransferase FdhD [Chloroflexota bacterium]